MGGDGQQFETAAEVRILKQRLEDDIKHRDEFRADMLKKLDALCEGVKSLHEHQATCVVIENDLKAVKGQVKTLWGFISAIVLTAFTAVINWFAKK